jgi:peptide deformylase
MKLVLDPDPVLKQLAVEWDFSVDKDAENIEKEMIDLMKTFHGRGLAGNQVGLLKRMFVIKLESTGQTLGMFNPKVVNLSETEQSAEEGCLSFPALWLKVKRPNKIDIEYLDKHGKECKMTLTGIDARCFLHELDHLNGITFTSKVSSASLMLAKKNQRKNKW